MRQRIRWDVLRVGILLPALAVSHYILQQVGIASLYPTEVIRSVFITGLPTSEIIFGFSGALLMMFCYVFLLAIPLKYIRLLAGRGFTASG